MNEYKFDRVTWTGKRLQVKKRGASLPLALCGCLAEWWAKTEKEAALPHCKHCKREAERRKAQEVQP